MTLYDPPALPRLSREEFDYNSVTRPTGFGDYMGAKTSEGWERSGLGTFLRDPFGAGERFGPLPSQPRETSREMGFDVDQARLTEQQWKDAGLAREGLDYSGGTLDYERTRTEEFDRRRFRDSVIARYQGNPMAYVAGFAAQVAGGGLSPENFIPFVGPAMRASMVARLGVIGGHAATGAVDAAIGNALLDAYVLPDLARRGEDVGVKDFAMDLVLGAVAGTAFGSYGGWVERRRAAANSIRSPGVVPMADALDHAHEAVLAGEPVNVDGYIRSTDIVDRMRRNGSDLVGGPDLDGMRAAATGGETIGRAEFVAGHEDAGGVLDFPKANKALIDKVESALTAGGRVTLNVEGRAVPIVRVINGMMADVEGNRWGTLGTLSSTENSVRIEHAAAGAQPTPPAATRALPEGLAIEKQKGGRYVVKEGDKEVARFALAGDGDKPFIDVARVEPAYQRQGIASAVYDFIERDIGRRLVPSPLGLSPEATALWQRRLNTMSPADRAAALDESMRIGTGYGIGAEHIEPRLAPLRRQPDLTTMATEIPPAPSVVEAEKTYKVVPPDFSSEQTARIKEAGLDAESHAADQALIQQARQHGDLNPADEAALEAAELEAKAHDAEAEVYDVMKYCAGRYG